MNYEMIYSKIIQKAKECKREKSKSLYLEDHHIFPKCLGGEDLANNMVLLTAKEHFICHHLLTKIHQTSDDLHSAFWLMCVYTSSNQERVKATSSVYATIKQRISKIQSKRTSEYNRLNPKRGEDNPMFGVHRFGEENPFFGKKHSEEAKLKIGLKNSTRIWSDSEKQKLKDSWKSRPLIICPHCQKQSIHASNMRRYHFDNCKANQQRE